MKKSKLIFALLLVTLTLTASIISTFAAVPPGRSGVNFAALPAQAYYTVFSAYRGDATDTARAGLNYDPAEGGMNLQVTTGQGFYAEVGLTMSVNLLVSGTDVFQYMNSTDRYYMSAALYLKNVSSNDTIVMHPTQIDIVMDDGSTFRCGGNDAFLKPSGTVRNIIFYYQNTERGIYYHAFELRAFSILQDNPTYGYLYGANPATAYVPFSSAYFEEQGAIDTALNQGYTNGYREGYLDGTSDGETKGYNEGYEQGAVDAGGEPIQKWGAFLVTATQGFLSFEIYPGFPLWGILAVALAIPLVLMFLKMFAGG